MEEKSEDGDSGVRGETLTKLKQLVFETEMMTKESPGTREECDLFVERWELGVFDSNKFEDYLKIVNRKTERLSNAIKNDLATKRERFGHFQQRLLVLRTSLDILDTAGKMSSSKKETFETIIDDVASIVRAFRARTLQRLIEDEILVLERIARFEKEIEDTMTEVRNMLRLDTQEQLVELYVKEFGILERAVSLKNPVINNSCSGLQRLLGSTNFRKSKKQRVEH